MATKLLIISPAPASKTSDSVISATTSAFRSRPRRKPPLTPFPESLSGSTRFCASFAAPARHTCEKCSSNLLDHLEQRSQRRSGGVRLPLCTPVMSLQREILFVTGLEQRPDLPQVIELSLPHRAPLDLAIRARRVIAQMDMDDPGRIEQPETVGKSLLARSAGIVRIPGQAERLLFDRLEQSRL